MLKSLKKDDEVERSTRETAALVKEATDVFRRSVSVYLKAVAVDMQRSVEKLRREGRTDEVVNELNSLAESLSVPLPLIRKHRIHMERGLRVVQHKNEVHANDRLFAALERMKREANDFQNKMKALAESKPAKTPNTGGDEYLVPLVN